MLKERTAFLFAGQGAQVPGMGMDFIHHPEVKRLYEMADSFKPGIIDLMRSGEPKELGKTINTQPCMYLADLASAIVRGEYYPPVAVCGFSVGEVPALSYAGVFSYETGFKVILERARIMSEASERVGGAMVAVIGLNEDVVRQIAAIMPCAYAANYNLRDQTVVACSEASVEPLRAAVLARGGKSIKLNVSGAFHCPLMSEASESFNEFLKGIKFNKPKFPVYSNVTALPYSGDFAASLALQMQKPVMFYQTISNMINMDNVTDFEEQGPGSVLTKMVAKITAK